MSDIGGAELLTATVGIACQKVRCRRRKGNASSWTRVNWRSAAVDGLRCPVFVRLELASFDVAGVLLNVGVPLLGKVIQRKYRRNWADWYAGAAVDALDRVNDCLLYTSPSPRDS